MTYCCIDATSRDFGRFGLLFARNGMWVEDEVIPSEWITESTTIASGLSYYGLHWWVYPASNFFAVLGFISVALSTDNEITLSSVLN